MNLTDPKIISISRKLAINPGLPSFKTERDTSLKTFSALTEYPKDAILLALKMDKGSGQQAVGCLLGTVFGCSDHNFSQYLSTSLCLAESLIVKQNLDIKDLLIRWHHWWNSGYCHLSGDDLPVKINASYQYVIDGIQQANSYQFLKPDANMMGSDSLARVAPVAIFSRNHPEWCLIMSQLQSYTTHGSEITAGCCATLGYLLNRLINHNEVKTNQDQFRLTIETILGDWLSTFESQLTPHPWREDDASKQQVMIETYSIICQLCRSQPEDALLNGIWNWKNKSLDIPDTLLVRRHHISFAKYFRDNQKLDYSPDCLAISLYIIYHSDSLVDIFNRLEQLNDDIETETIKIIVGNLVGAFYGYQVFLTNTTLSRHYDDLKKLDNDRLVITACLLFLRAN